MKRTKLTGAILLTEVRAKKAAKKAAKKPRSKNK